jgi:repressor LexA
VETPEEHETIRVPSHMTRKASYALRVRGHSMIDDQIQHAMGLAGAGDYCGG